MKSDKLERSIIDRSTYDFPKQEGRVQRSKNRPEEELVERLAKAACVAAGYEVDAICISDGEPIWKYHRTFAKQFLAMTKALQDG